MQLQLRSAGNYLKHFTATILCFVGLTAYPQYYNFKSFSLEDGLSQSQALVMFEDSRGFLWIGTAGGGVCRFDGKGFISYEEKDGLCGQIVTSISEDAKGNMWFGSTWGGMCSFDGNKFTKYTVQDGLLSNNITSILSDGDKLLIGTIAGLSILSKGKITSLAQDPKTYVSLHISCMYKDQKGVVWIGTNNGLYFYANGGLEKPGNGTKSPNGHIISITRDGPGSILVCESPNQFFSLDVATGDARVIKPGLIGAGENILACFKDSYDRLWISVSGKGILRIYSGIETWLNKSNGLSNHIINCFYEDRSGNLWIGTNGSGFMRYRDDRFLYFYNTPVFSSEGIFALHAEAGGKVWAGTLGDGLGYWDGKETKFFKGISDRVNAICTTKEGITYIGGGDGLFIYSNGNITPKKLSDTLTPNIRAIFQDSKGNIWIGASGSGLFRLNKDGVKFFTEKDGSYNRNVYNFVETDDGRIWFGTGDGLYYYDGSKINQVRASTGLCNSYVGSLVKDKHGNLWIGTDRCIAYFSGSDFRSYDEKDGLASGTVYLMTIDTEGYLWVGTNKGIDRVKIRKDGTIEGIKNYGSKEGFTGIECNSRAVTVDNKGNIWFGTIKGAIRYAPFHESSDTIAPQVFINKIRLQYEDVNWAKFKDTLTPWFNLPADHVFSYGQNHISFDMLSTSKTIPEKVKYSYMLEGFDKEWSPAAKTEYAIYSNLPPGKYTFKVKAINGDGKESITPASFSFRILYPFWASWWFITICLATLLLSINRYNKIRKAKLEKANKELEQIVVARTSELIKQKEEKEILLKEIHHRVKNNLQVINSLINIQSSNITDKHALNVFEECKNRIKSIALIHESLYKSNEVSRINVREYMSMMMKSLLETYPVDKEIELKMDLNVSYLNLNTILPLGLMLNEIITNTIKYAFPEKSKGEIYIQLKPVDDENYEMTIGDNGVGYKGEPFAVENPTLGLELVKILTEQLEGTITKLDVPGTFYFLKFKPAKK